MGTTKCLFCLDRCCHLFISVSWAASNTPHLKVGKEKKSTWAFREKRAEEGGQVELASYPPLRQRKDTQLEESNLPSAALSFPTFAHTQPTSLNLRLSLPISEMFLSIWFSLFVLHNGTLRNLYPPSSPSHYTLPLSPFLSSTFSSSTASFPHAPSLTSHLSLSHYSKGATMLRSWPSVMAHGLSGWEIANVAQMKY